jgi:Rod binding domain-containing protein
MEGLAPTAPGLRASATHQPLQEKTVKAAHDFEAFLLTSLLGPLERSFSAVPGEPSMAGADNYQYLGIQALAAGLANSGGIGIADLLLRQLKVTKVPG